MKRGNYPIQYITHRKEILTKKQATEARKGDLERVFLFFLFIVKVFPNFHVVQSAE